MNSAVQVLEEELENCNAEIVDIEKLRAELDEKERLLRDRYSFTQSLIKKVKQAEKTNPKK